MVTSFPPPKIPNIAHLKIFRKGKPTKIERTLCLNLTNAFSKDYLPFQTMFCIELQFPIFAHLFDKPALK